MPICLNNLKRKTSVSFIFMCVLIMLGCLSSVGQAEEDRKIFVDLFGYGMKTLDVPIAFKNNFQRAKLNQTFLNAEVQATDLCKLQSKPINFIKTISFNHNLKDKLGNQVSIEQRIIKQTTDLWTKYFLWHAIQFNNNVLCVFENGEFILYKLYEAFFMLIDINEVQNSQVGKIPVLKYGKFVKGEKTANSDEFLLYISEDQCYFVDKNITWFPIDGCLAFGEDLQTAKMIGSKLFVAAGLKGLFVFTVNHSQKTLQMVTKRSLFVKFQNISVLLHVEDLEYDPVSSTVYIIDPKEGVHMFKLMAEQSQNATTETKLVIPAESCECLVIDGGLLYASCSHLTVMNASTGTILATVGYQFYVNELLINQSTIFAIGIIQFSIYQLLWVDKSLLLVKFEQGRFHHQTSYRQTLLMEIKSLEWLVIVDDFGVTVGKLQERQQKISCSVKDDKQLKQGQFISSLQVMGKCQDKLRIKHDNQTTSQSQCSITYPLVVSVTLPPKSIKWIIIIVMGSLLLLITVVTLVYIFVARRMLKNEQYKQLTEQSFFVTKQKQFLSASLPQNQQITQQDKQ